MIGKVCIARVVINTDNKDTAYSGAVKSNASWQRKQMGTRKCASGLSPNYPIPCIVISPQII